MQIRTLALIATLSFSAATVAGAQTTGTTPTSTTPTSTTPTSTNSDKYNRHGDAVGDRPCKGTGLWPHKRSAAHREQGRPGQGT